MAASRLGLAYQKLSLQLITYGLKITQLLLHILMLNNVLIRISRVVYSCKVGKRVFPLLTGFLGFILELLKEEAGDPLLISLKLRIA